MSLFKEIQDVTCCTTVNTSKKEENEPKSWFVMRDLKRVNAKLPAYKLLRNSEFEVFTPMKWRLVKKNKGRDTGYPRFALRTQYTRKAGLDG